MLEFPRLWLLALTVAFALPAGAVEIKDDLGQVTTLTAPPQRVVSLLPSLTETELPK